MTKTALIIYVIYFALYINMMLALFIITIFPVKENRISMFVPLTFSYGKQMAL